MSGPVRDTFPRLRCEDAFQVQGARCSAGQLVRAHRRQTGDATHHRRCTSETVQTDYQRHQACCSVGQEAAVARETDQGTYPAYQEQRGTRAQRPHLHPPQRWWQEASVPFCRFQTADPRPARDRPTLRVRPQPVRFHCSDRLPRRPGFLHPRPARPQGGRHGRGYSRSRNRYQTRQHYAAVYDSAWNDVSQPGSDSWQRGSDGPLCRCRVLPARQRWQTRARARPSGVQGTAVRPSQVCGDDRPSLEPAAPPHQLRKSRAIEMAWPPPLCQRRGHEPCGPPYGRWRRAQQRGSALLLPDWAVVKRLQDRQVQVSPKPLGCCQSRGVEEEVVCGLS
mmetsp:Transcript_6077/g.9435  ORF Transcript_6077/g.9435 Transcript_6077/m.9435 type:complete len:336 (-) Transcript_6077:229-1236(-)